MSEDVVNRRVCYFMPMEYGDLERLLDELGYTAQRGKLICFEGVHQKAYTFKTAAICDYVMFHMNGWYFNRHNQRVYEWTRPVPGVEPTKKEN